MMAQGLKNYKVTVAPGRALHVATRDMGADLTLFFVHGGGGNKNQWRKQFAHFLPTHINIIAWDAFGHGKSQNSKREEDFTEAQLYNDMGFIFEKYKTRKNIIVAHSFGCRITLAWLLHTWQQKQVFPLDGAVFLGPAPHEQARRGLFNNWMDNLPLPIMEMMRPLLARRFEALAWFPGTAPDILAEERKATRQNSLFMMRALLRNGPIFQAEKLRDLPAFPVSLIAGKQDGIVPFSTVKKLEKTLPAAILHQIDQCGHQIMLEKPIEVNQVIEQLIQRVEAE